ncbi:MAG: hypothetical protein AAB531_03440 [Patescibacteria group bacterium]
MPESIRQFGLKYPENFSPSERIIPVERAVKEARRIVEKALATNFANSDMRFWPVEEIRQWKEKLSVYATKVHPDVTPESMRGKCFLIAEELRSSLLDNGQEVEEIRTTQKPYEDGHAYLRAFYRGYEIFIDPTIAQFIERHNHVFVGTKDQLRYLALTRSREGFESIWGEKD